MICSRFFILFTFLMSFVCSAENGISLADQAMKDELLANLKGRVHQYVLDNGVQVICIPVENGNAVTVGSYVRVGSMHEEATEEGMAHILEHMIFKGTKNRKEGELDKICSHFGMKGGRDYNAFTRRECTVYYFKTDDKNWKTFADVVVDSTQNLEVLPAPLDSELQAIVQELKMGQQDVNSLGLSDFFPVNNSSVHPVIGYKENILRYTADQVMDFYNKHYIPAKTTFFVLGKVNPSEVFDYASQAFTSFTRGSSLVEPVVTLPKQPFYAGFATKNVMQYQTQEKKEVEFLWAGPAAYSADIAPLRCLTSVLNRRLQQKYVDDLGYCFSAGAGFYSFGATSLASVFFSPRPSYYEYDFAVAIADEVRDIQENGITQTEVATLYQEFLGRLGSEVENPFSLIHEFAILSSFYSDSIAAYFETQEVLSAVTQDGVKRVAYDYMRPFLMQRSTTVMLPLEEQGAWQALQSEVSQYEQELMSARKRDELSTLSLSENTNYLPERVALDLPPRLDYETFTLPSGLVVYWQRDVFLPRRVCGLVVKNIDQVTTPLVVQRKSFALSVLSDLLLHGTDQYSVKEFNDLLDARGISLSAGVGFVALGSFKHNFEEGLQLLRLALDKTNYDRALFERKKQEALDAIASQKNNPLYRVRDFLNQTMYGDCSWLVGENDTIKDIQNSSFEDAVSSVSLLKDPRHVALVLTGDFTELEARLIAERYFGDLSEKSSLVRESFTMPKESVVQDVITLPLGVSFVVGVRSGCTLSGDLEPAFNLIATYLNRKVWEIREQTGLFYGGSANFTNGSEFTRGALNIIVQTTPANAAIVLGKLQSMLLSASAEGVMTASSFDVLKTEFKHSLGIYSSSASIAANKAIGALLSGASFNYVRELEERVMALTFDEFERVVQEYCNPSSWSFVTVGQ